MITPFHGQSCPLSLAVDINKKNGKDKNSSSPAILPSCCLSEKPNVFQRKSKLYFCVNSVGSPKEFIGD
jgi:hypothetical protein